MTGNRYRAAARFRAELRQFLRHSEQCARARGITPKQHQLLLQIGGSDDGTSTVSELVRTLSLTQSTVTELVQRAEQAGLVARTGSVDDARVTHISLTEAGERALADVHEALGPERAELRRMLEALDE